MPYTLPVPYVKKLMEYSWPGNVRQLKNFIEQLVILSDLRFNRETFEELYLEMIKYQPNAEKPEKETSKRSLSEQINSQKTDNETEIIRETLEKAQYSKSKTAEILGISRTTLWRKLKNM